MEVVSLFCVFLHFDSQTRSFIGAPLLLGCWAALFRWRLREVLQLSFTELICPTSVGTSAALEMLLLLHYSVHSDRSVKQKCFDAAQCARCSKLMIIINDSKEQSPKYLLTHIGIVTLLQQTSFSTGLLQKRSPPPSSTSDSLLYWTQMLIQCLNSSLICFSSTVASLLFPLFCERGSV